MLIKKLFAVFLIFTFLISGCASHNGPSGSPQVGPVSSSQIASQDGSYAVIAKARPYLDIIVPVFDPGLPDNPNDYDDEGIWPELRRAEANRFAVKIKNALEDTGAFGAVRVTPDASATGDLYVLGRIEKSNGAEVEIDIEVIDISGDRWFSDSYDHEVPENFHSNIRNNGKDPYDPVFAEVAADIVDELNDFDNKELFDLQYLSNIRFGANFSDQAFAPYITQKYGTIRLRAKPSEDNPMLKRVKGLRVRDQLFVDSLQTNYQTFNDQMNVSYLMWQKESRIEVEAERAANRAKIRKAVGGTLLIALAALSTWGAIESDSAGGSVAGTTGAVVAGMAGSEMIQESFKKGDEAEMHEQALEELGQSLDLELAPQVVAFEKETVQLTGDAREQFNQWRKFLQKLYDQERTPDIQL